MARTRLRLSGRAMLRYIRPGGLPGWRHILPNGVTDEGLNWLLNVNFRAQAPSAALYVGLINETGYTAVDSGDTHMVHAGWSEWTAISGNRQTWIPLAANGGLMGSSTPATFNITADGQIRGIFLSTISTVGSLAAGTLYNTVVALTGLDVENGGTLEVTPSVRIGE